MRVKHLQWISCRAVRNREANKKNEHQIYLLYSRSSHVRGKTPCCKDQCSVLRVCLVCSNVLGRGSSNLPLHQHVSHYKHVAPLCICVRACGRASTCANACVVVKIKDDHSVRRHDLGFPCCSEQPAVQPRLPTALLAPGR